MRNHEREISAPRPIIMSKPRACYVCQQCGSVEPRWQGRCPACGGWNSLHEEVVSTRRIPRHRNQKAGLPVAVPLKSGQGADPGRILTGIAEFDRVAGGGIADSGVILLGGDPGIGKSTLILQILAGIGQAGHQALYITGEEAANQICLRAARLGLESEQVNVVSETALETIMALLSTPPRPSVVAIDSIQTLWSSALEAAPGTVSQLRATTQELIRTAKHHAVALLLVGHVTKEGQLAGPRVVEHMVDTVLYFEGERNHHLRLLRAVKNRFGPIDEIGVFEMTGAGLQEIANPSALFLASAGAGSLAPGTAIFAAIEGTRPVLIEIQALTSSSPFGLPRRTVVGWDANRLAMLIAVLEARAGISFSGMDVFLNVAGGLRITDPAADLAVAGALVSTIKNCPLPENTVLFGEISLTGMIRPVSRPDIRLKEAQKLGFSTIWMPSPCQSSKNELKIIEMAGLQDLTIQFT